jgi:hypothetical protein
MSKLKLPIEISVATPEQWRDIESRLMAIAHKERQELDPPDRLANKSLALAQSYAKNREWGDLFRFLIERNLIKIESSVIAPPPKPPKQPKPRINTVKQQFKKLLPDILHSDRAISLETIKCNSIALGFEIHPRLYRDYLSIFCKQGLIYKHPESTTKYVFYSLQPTNAIDKAEWLPAKLIFPIAVANGYPHTLKALVNVPLRRRDKAEIAAIFAGYGIEYNADHIPLSVCNWRIK